MQRPARGEHALFDRVRGGADQGTGLGQAHALDGDQQEGEALLGGHALERPEEGAQVVAGLRAAPLVSSRTDQGIELLFGECLGAPPLVRAQVVEGGRDGDAIQERGERAQAPVFGQRLVKAQEDLLDQVVALWHGTDEPGHPRVTCAACRRYSRAKASWSPVRAAAAQLVVGGVDEQRLGPR